MICITCGNARRIDDAGYCAACRPCVVCGAVGVPLSHTQRCHGCWYKHTKTTRRGCQPDSLRAIAAALQVSHTTVRLARHQDRLAYADGAWQLVYGGSSEGWPDDLWGLCRECRNEAYSIGLDDAAISAYYHGGRG